MEKYADDASKIAALGAKAAASRANTDEYFQVIDALPLAEKFCAAWGRFLHAPVMRAIWLDWEKSDDDQHRRFITGAIAFLCDEFGVAQLPVSFQPFIPGTSPAAEFSPDGFVFYGRSADVGVTGQITHEFTHYLQSYGMSSVPVAALLIAYTMYITPTKAAATDRTAQFVKSAFERLFDYVPDAQKPAVRQALEDYERQGQMYDNFGNAPSDAAKILIREIYSESIIEVEAAFIADHVRQKLADLRHIEKMNFWTAV